MLGHFSLQNAGSIPWLQTSQSPRSYGSSLRECVCVVCACEGVLTKTNKRDVLIEIPRTAGSVVPHSVPS